MSRKLNPETVLFCMGSLAYPFLIYFFGGKVSPAIWVLIALILLAARFYTLPRYEISRFTVAVFLSMAAIIITCLIVNGSLAAKAYPVVMSLGAACLFGISLIFPPTLVERIARLTEPDLSQEGIFYTRKVTILWTSVLLLNAAISLSTALLGNIEIWTLWNGLLSYFMMGIVFAAEFLVRRKIRAQ